MGPNEEKLLLANAARRETLQAKSDQWDSAGAALEDLAADLEAARRKTADNWVEGSDSEAAKAVFSQKIKSARDMKSKIDAVAAGLSRTSIALKNAEAAWRALPAPNPVPTAPAAPLVGGRAAEAKYKADQKNYEADQKDYKASLEQREVEAGKALTALDNELNAARQMFATAAPGVPAKDRDPGFSAGSGQAAPGASASAPPVIGGTTSAAGVIANATLGRRPNASRGGLGAPAPTGSATPSNQPTRDGRVDQFEDGVLGNKPTPQEAGQFGGGGIAGATGGAAVAGAAKRMVGRSANPSVLTRNTNAANSSPSTLGRTASPAAGRSAGPASAPRQGSTLGTRPNAPASGARPSSTAPGRSASPASGTRPGSTAPGRSASPGSGARQSSVLGTRPNASANGARPSTSTSEARAGTNASGRTAVPVSRTNTASSSPRPGVAASGSRAGAPTSAARPGPAAANRSAAPVSGARPGAGVPGSTASPFSAANNSAQSGAGSGSRFTSGADTRVGNQGPAAGGRSTKRSKDDKPRRKRRRFVDDWTDGDDQAYPPVLR